MFSSKGKEKDSLPPAMPAAPAAGQKRPLRSGAAPSIISGDLTVTGTLSSSGDIQIDGRVEGDVHSAGLVIGDKAFIHGDIVSEEVTVRGRVQGSIRARKVLLASTCHVEGNILHEAFAVETGAFFEGNCRHADNPLADEAAKKAPEYRSTSAASTAAAAVSAPAPSAPAASAPPASSPVSSMVSRPMTSAATFTPLKTN
jgi:cytoskeletal protein CcmA (bactofilin family)